jgi:hypothetical protein
MIPCHFPLIIVNPQFDIQYFLLPRLGGGERKNLPGERGELHGVHQPAEGGPRQPARGREDCQGAGQKS